MIDLDFRATHEMKDILRSILGKCVTRIEGTQLFDGVFWDVVRIRLEDGSAVDVRNCLEELVLGDDGETEELGVVSIGRGQAGPPRFEGMDDPVFLDVQQAVRRVGLVQNRVVVSSAGQRLSDRSYIQATILELSDGMMLAIDKQTWFEEMLVVSMGRCVEELIRDESVDWEDDPLDAPLDHFDFSSELVWL